MGGVVDYEYEVKLLQGSTLSVQEQIQALHDGEDWEPVMVWSRSWFRSEVVFRRAKDVTAELPVVAPSP